MGRGAIGTGELIGAEIEPEADLLAIFALWSGAINTDGARFCGRGRRHCRRHCLPGVRGQGIWPSASRSVSRSPSATPVSALQPEQPSDRPPEQLANMLQPIFSKIFAKIGAKISAKIGAKVYAKAVVGFVPFLGACVGTGISLYILD